MTSNPLAQPGAQFHTRKPIFIRLRDGDGFGVDSVQLLPGQTATLTADMVAAQKDINGDSIFDRLGDPACVLQPGPWPEGAETWQRRGDPEWAEQRERARRNAYALSDPEEQAQALAEVRRRFGVVPTSQTISEDASSKLRDDLSRIDGVARGGAR